MKTLKRVLIGMFLGLAGGLPGGWFAYAHLGPELGFDGRSEVSAVVEARRVDADRVQLMLRGEDGASILATFTERPSDVAALARVGDTVVLSLAGEAPIVDEPTIVRVQPAEADEDAPRPDPFSGEAVAASPDADGGDIADAEGEDAEGEDAEGEAAEGEAAEGTEGAGEAAAAREIDLSESV